MTLDELKLETLATEASRSTALVPLHRTSSGSELTIHRAGYSYLYLTDPATGVVSRRTLRSPAPDAHLGAVCD